MCNFNECMDQWEEWFDSNNSRCIVNQVQYLLFDTFIFKILLISAYISLIFTLPNNSTIVSNSE
jgi:hypothetical protein